jgi:hypothetical protein
MGVLGSQAPYHDDSSVTIGGPEELPELPAAVGLACYRVVLKAPTNAVRHAKARGGRGSSLYARAGGRARRLCTVEAVPSSVPASVASRRARREAVESERQASRTSRRHEP